MKQRKLRRELTQPDLATTLEALKQGEDSKISSTVYYGLSGLKASDLEPFETVWATLDEDYRRKVMRRLVEAGEANVEMNYNMVGHHALSDSDPGVREAAIELLFEDYSISLLDRLIDMAQEDDVPEVRAAAASALGRFILAAELGDFPEIDALKAQDAAVTIWTNEDEEIDVRRRALEAISNSGHEIVNEAIDDAYKSRDLRLQASALFAMGRSYDERWNPIVLRELDSPEPELSYEAARAAGELETRAAIPGLVRLAQGRDREITEVAIWSLGEIGGLDATRALTMIARRAEEAGDEELVEVIEDALLNAELVDHDVMGTGDLDD